MPTCKLALRSTSIFQLVLISSIILIPVDSYLQRLRAGQQSRRLERPRPRVDLQVPTSPHPYSVLPFTVYNCDFVFMLLIFVLTDASYATYSIY